MGIEIKRERRFYIRKNDCGKGIVMAFPTKDAFYAIDHDELIRVAAEHSPYLETPSWREGGEYSIVHPGPEVRKALEPYRIPRNR